MFTKFQGSFKKGITKMTKFEGSIVFVVLSYLILNNELNINLFPNNIKKFQAP